MSTYYPNTRTTLLDRAKRTSEGKKVLPIIAVMNEKVDDFFQDVPFMECNRGLYHHILRDTGMVASTKRSLYAGVRSSKRNVQPVDEHIMQMVRRRRIDPDELAGLDEGGRVEYLDQEDTAHQRKLGEDVVNEFFNGLETSGSEYCLGLFGRLDALNPTGLNNVISNGGSDASNNTSALLVEWNTDKTGGAHGIYPSGWMGKGPMGIQARNLGEGTSIDEDDTQAELEVLRAVFKAWHGLAVGNNRKIARLANINSSTWDHADSFVNGGTERLINMIHNGRFDRSRTRIYVNTVIAAQMDIYALNKGNTQWPTTEVFGRQVKQWQGIPIREMDTTIISNSQSVVS
jgi:hypothetical protein